MAGGRGLGRGAIVRTVRLLLLGSLLAGVGLVAGAPSSSAWSNYCTDEATPPGGPDVGVDFGPGLAYAGATLGHGTADGDPAVCVNDETYAVHYTTTSGAYVWVNHCTGGPCAPLLGDTGIKPSGTTTINILPVTTVDPGYDLYVDGTNLTP